MIKTEAGKLRMAKIDELISNFLHKPIINLDPIKPDTRIKVHVRRGKQIGLKTPDGLTLYLTGQSKIHLYDIYGNLVDRFQANKPPQGHTVFNKKRSITY